MTVANESGEDFLSLSLSLYASTPSRYAGCAMILSLYIFQCVSLSFALAVVPCAFRSLVSARSKSRPIRLISKRHSSIFSRMAIASLFPLKKTLKLNSCCDSLLLFLFLFFSSISSLFSIFWFRARGCQRDASMASESSFALLATNLASLH